MDTSFFSATSLQGHTSSGKPAPLRTIWLLLPALAVASSACTTSQPPVHSNPASAVKRTLVDSLSEDSKALYVRDVVAAARNLIERTPADQRQQLVFPFDSMERTRGQDTSQTPSFCAILQWCPVGWGLTQCSMNDEQLLAMQVLLASALSPGGYEMLLSVMNRNRVVGEMEDVADSRLIPNAVKQCPDAQANNVFELSKACPGAGAASGENSPHSHKYPVVGGSKTYVTGETLVQWDWDPVPGLAKRRQQFCNYTMAIFGDVDSDNWGFRFEGHHATVNMQFRRDPETGTIHIHNTPLFFGAFPMIVPPDPYPADDAKTQWKWSKGQIQMYGVAHHLRQFWRAVAEDVRTTAFIGAEHFPQAKPLRLNTFPSSMLATLSPTVDNKAIEAYPHVDIDANALDTKALWHLQQALSYYTGAIMHPSVGQHYLQRVTAALKSGTALTVAWAGGALDELGANHYSYVAAGPLILEFLQSNQYSVQHDANFTGNHVHSMLRDIKYKWDYNPMAEHHVQDHLTPAASP